MKLNCSKKITAVLILVCLCMSAVFCASKKEKKPVDPTKPYITNNEGFSFAYVNRIQKQEKRSNFVWQDSMLGVFYALQTHNLPLNIYGRVAAYYPFAYTFNKVPQASQQVILYAFDLFVGPVWVFNVGKAFRIQMAPGFHTMYQLHDKAHYVNVGGGVDIGFELPITKGFTMLLNGFFTYESGNCGTNGRMQPFDYCWTYQASLGVRFSRYPNNFYYIKSKKDRQAAAAAAEQTVEK